MTPTYLEEKLMTFTTPCEEPDCLARPHILVVQSHDFSGHRAYLTPSDESIGKRLAEARAQAVADRLTTLREAIETLPFEMGDDISHSYSEAYREGWDDALDAVRVEFAILERTNP